MGLIRRQPQLPDLKDCLPTRQLDKAPLRFGQLGVVGSPRGPHRHTMHRCVGAALIWNHNMGMGMGRLHAAGRAFTYSMRPMRAGGHSPSPFSLSLPTYHKLQSSLAWINDDLGEVSAAAPGVVVREVCGLEAVYLIPDGNDQAHLRRDAWHSFTGLLAS